MNARTYRHPRKQVLFVCGSLNQTKMMHAVGRELEADYDTFYAPFYADGLVGALRSTGLFDFILEKTVMGGRFRQMTLDYLREHRLEIRERGEQIDPALVVTCSDVLVQRNIRPYPIVLVQEGATNLETPLTRFARATGLPPWCGGGTTMAGESGLFDVFCVASEGYRDFFEKKGRGVPREKMVVTGIPNFDDCEGYKRNDFPHKNFVLIATSDLRETQMSDDRIGFLKRCRDLAGGRQVIVKLHPNEEVDRAKREIASVFPEALVYTSGCAEEMVANCDMLLTQYSTLAFVGLALGKPVQTYYDLEELKRLVPWQNGGRSAKHIGAVCRRVLEAAPEAPLRTPEFARPLTSDWSFETR